VEAAVAVPSAVTQFAADVRFVLKFVDDPGPKANPAEFPPDVRPNKRLKAVNLGITTHLPVLKAGKADVSSGDRLAERMIGSEAGVDLHCHIPWTVSAEVSEE
jgi:hypothetical protein